MIEQRPLDALEWLEVALLLHFGRRAYLLAQSVAVSSFVLPLTHIAIARASILVCIAQYKPCSWKWLRVLLALWHEGNLIGHSLF